MTISDFFFFFSDTAIYKMSATVIVLLSFLKYIYIHI